MNPDSWVDTHGDALYRYALSRVRNPTVAEDLVQETFLAAIQSQQSYQGNSSELTWLTGILRHKTLDFFRKSSRANEQSLDAAGTEDVESPFNAKGAWDSPPSTWSSPHRSLERDEFWSKIQSCIATLPEAMRRSFVLREFDGLESDAVAEILDITTNNLWVMLSRARLKLRQCLQSHWFTGNA
jgi:RNA polymerase sigma-70 factor (ECF subfamily)